MKMTKLGIMRGGLAAVAMAAACAGFAQAQTYPAKSIRMIFPFPPGGPTDLLGRAIAQKMSDQMGQQVVADNPVPAATSVLSWRLNRRLMATPSC